MERLEKVAEARSRLLRVEELGPGGGATTPGFLLTFEVGRLLVKTDPATGEVQTEHIEGRDGLPGPIADAGEEEPWWRLMGFPLTRVARASGSGGVRMQFREDDENPKVIVISPEAAEVRVFLDPKGWNGG